MVLGAEVAYKWMGVVRFNSDGKIYEFADLHVMTQQYEHVY